MERLASVLLSFIYGQTFVICFRPGEVTWGSPCQ